MNPLPIKLTPRAGADLELAAPELRPAVLEHLARIGADHVSCSRRSSFPHPEGWVSGLWCRHAGGRAALVEVLFRVEVEPDRIVVRRVVIVEHPRLPGWVVNPSEWMSPVAPWPIVDV